MLHGVEAPLFFEISWFHNKLFRIESCLKVSLFCSSSFMAMDTCCVLHSGLILRRMHFSVSDTELVS